MASAREGYEGNHLPADGTRHVGGTVALVAAVAIWQQAFGRVLESYWISGDVF